MNRNAVAAFYFRGETHDVPIGKTNTTVAGRAADRIGLMGSMDTDTLFVECNPDYTNRISWAWREQMEIAAALAVLKHLFVVTKSRHLGDSPDFPFANGRLSLSGTDCHRAAMILSPSNTPSILVLVSIFTATSTGPASFFCVSLFSSAFLVCASGSSSTSLTTCAATSLPGLISFTEATSNGSTLGTRIWSPDLNVFVLPGFSCSSK